MLSIHGVVSRFAVFTLLTSCGYAQQMLTIYPATGSEVYMEVGKTGIMAGKTHHISFPAYSGTVHYDAKNPANSTVEIDIETATLSVDDKWLSDGDKAKVREFALDHELATGKFPRIKFRSQSVTPSGENKYAIQGQLTIRDKTVPATLNATVTPDGQALRIEGKSELKLSDFKLERPKAALGAIGTKDDFIVGFRIRAEPPK